MPDSIVLKGLDIRKSYSRGKLQVEVLKGIDLSISQGETLAIMGPSGAGKSTLLQILGAMNVPDSGSLEIGGVRTENLNDNDLSKLRRQKIGFVFQSFNLLPSLSAAENVAWPLLLDGIAHKEGLERAHELLAAVGLGQRSHHLPGELSGGEQQRVAIARALVARPAIVLADEPTGALDSATGELVLELLETMRVKYNCALVIVTHDPGVAARCHRLISLKDGRVLP